MAFKRSAVRSRLSPPKQTRSRKISGLFVAESELFEHFNNSSVAQSEHFSEQNGEFSKILFMNPATAFRSSSKAFT